MRELKMFSLFSFSTPPTSLLTSKLFNEHTFYPKFLKDLNNCQKELIIECPFITNKRLGILLPTFEKLKKRGVRIAINTRDPEDHGCEYMRSEAVRALSTLHRIGIQVIYTDNHHRKLAILDRHILWEGSLNILSQNNSSELMRRIESVQLSWEMIRYLDLDRLLN
jgi:phosphatidylserine/phosphatidylglycerophosphate/cardiolipin synthase-like enzyme